MKSLYQHTYSCTENHHIHGDPDCLLKCETAFSPGGNRPPYPVLDIGRVTFFPTHDQLRELWRVIGCWLDDEASRANPEE